MGEHSLDVRSRHLACFGWLFGSDDSRKADLASKGKGGREERRVCNEQTAPVTEGSDE